MKMTKMKESDRAELERVQSKGRTNCRDYFGGFLKRDGFIRIMIEYPYTDESLSEAYTPNALYPELPGTFSSIVDWGLGCGYIGQEEYDEIRKGRDVAV